MVYLLWTRISLANFYEAVSLAFIKRNSCPAKFDFERHEAVCFCSNSQAVHNVQTACLPIHPPLFYYFRAELHISWVFCWKNVPCATGLYDCILLYIPFWILPCLVDPNVSFMGWCCTDTHSRKPGQKAWQSVWWRAIMVPCAKVWITSLMKTFVNWIIARRRPDQMTSFPTNICDTT